MKGTRVETPSESVRNRTSCVYRVRKGRWECTESRPNRRGREEACQCEPERRWARASATEDEGWGGGWRRKAEDGGRAGLIAHMSDAGAAGRTSRALGCDTTVNSESERRHQTQAPTPHMLPSTAFLRPPRAIPPTRPLFILYPPPNSYLSFRLLANQIPSHMGHRIICAIG